MRLLAALSAPFALVAALAGATADEWFDRVGESLTFASADASVRARVSGLVDLDGYWTPDTRSDPRFTANDSLFSPRLTVFLDAQFGARAYLFGQARVDRGFDPADDSLEARLDEVALRVALLPEERLHLQAGKFATIIGAWSARHHSWENPFVTAPLVFENLTAIWDRSITQSPEHLLRRAHVEPASGSAGIAGDKDRRLPVIWGPAYASGAALTGRWGRLDYAAELKNSAPSARPESWDLGDRPWGDPVAGARVGFRPDESWTLGVSASRGTYLSKTAIPTATAGTDADDYEQSILAADVGFAHRHLQCWAEFYSARFEVPTVGEVATTAYYLEAKYKFAPQLFGAMRWNQQTYSRITTTDGRRVPWGRDTWRIDLALIHRLSAHAQVKLQYSPQHETPAPRQLTHAVAMQVTTRF